MNSAYYGNEDAGDSEAYNAAEFSAEQAERAQARYEAAFDAATDWTRVSALDSFFYVGGYVHKGRIRYRLHGCRQAPACGECGHTLARDDAAVVEDGEFLHSGECFDKVVYGTAACFERQEFPTYG